MLSYSLIDFFPERRSYLIGNSASKNKLVVLCILDGVGYSEKKEHNAVKQAKTPVLDKLKNEYQHTLLQCSGLYIGLPKGQKGNSEIGHSVMGLGRVTMRDLPRISRAIEHRILKLNDSLNDIVDDLQESGRVCHVWGLLSDAGEHSHYKHLYGILDFLTKNNINTKVHICLDGRDTPPKVGLCFVQDLQKLYGKGIIATVGGRHFEMDREGRWERIARAYNEIVAPSNFVEDAESYISECYSKGVFDEFIPPVAIEGYNGISDGDSFISFNFRTDGVEQMLLALTANDICTSKIMMKPPKFSSVVSMTECSKKLADKIIALFPREKVKNSLGEVLSESGMTQLRASETEKRLHVTFFFDGGEEKVYQGEEILTVESPQVSTYDLCPEMSAEKLTDAIIDNLNKDKFNVYIINFANGDMVGHTGNFEATKKAIECVDKCVGRIFDVVKNKDGHMLITSDHGNAEEMFDEERGQPNIFHTTNCVLFILASEKYKEAELRLDNNLSDIAPTILDILGIKCPEEMMGDSMIANVEF